MQVRIKKLNEKAVVPQYAKKGDSGMDLTATSKYYDEYGNICYGTGLAFEIPQGYVGLVFPRSSTSHKQMVLANCVAVIDSGYRGEVVMKFKPSLALKSNQCVTDVLTYGVYKVGERIAQMVIMPYPPIEFVEVEELSQTERGGSGYGSTDKKEVIYGRD